MSAVVKENPVHIAIRSEESRQEQKLRPHAARWVWQPFIDLSFMSPTGVSVKNSVKAEQADEMGNVFIGLRRCNPYLLEDYTYNVPPHEQKGNDLGASYGNWAPGVELITEPITDPKTALECANELYFKYGADYGLVILEPLTGITDTSLVSSVFQIVQPFAYHLHNMEHELTEGVAERLKGADVPKDVRDLVEGCRLLMLTGARRGLKFASERYGEFDRDARSYLASKQGRHTPNDFDRFIATQVGLEVPTVIQQTPQQPESPKYLELLERLTENALEKNADKDQMAARLAELEEQRERDAEERRALMTRLDELVAAKEQDAKVPTKAARN